MKLIKCYVSSFGKIKDKEFNFDGGLNTVKEDNGWGKTTLATFIKAMFYGLDGTGKRNINDNERKKYKPWNSTETFGGYVEFLWGGKGFKIERYFGSKETDDTVALYDLATGKKYNNTDNLGRRIFEIDEEGFLSTTYFSQKDFEIKSNASITAKFNSVCEYDDGSFDKALAKIEQKYKTYKYSGDRGLIADTRREIFNLAEDIGRAGNMVETCKTIKKEVDNLEEQVKVLEKECLELTDRVMVAGKAEAVAVKKERYAELVKTKNSLIQEKSTYDAVLNGKIPTESEIETYKNNVEELSRVGQSISLIQEELQSVVKNEEKPQEKPRSKKAVICAAIITLLFLVEGIITITSNVVLGVVGFVLFALCAAGTIILALPKKEKEKIDPYAEFVNERRNKLAECIELQKQYAFKVESFYNSYNIPQDVNGLSAAHFVVDAVKKSLHVSEKLKEVDEKLAAYNGDISVLSPEKVVYEDVNMLRETLRVKQTQYGDKARELTSKKNSLNKYIQASEELNDMEAKKAELELRMESYKAEYDVLVKTADFLKQADENLKVKYRAPLQNSLDKYLSLIDGGENKVKIDVDLNVTAIEKGKEFDTGYYSKGYQNLFEICKRFALTDVLFTGEKPFIILDDPFYNLDDQKIVAAIDLIKKLSQEYQIIYFVCHESRRA